MCVCVCVCAGQVVVCERNRDETKLLLACEDGTLVSSEIRREVNHSANAFVTSLGYSEISLIRTP